MLNKLKKDFIFWRNGLTMKQRKYIKTGIEVFIVLFIIGGFMNVYSIGETNGKIGMCKTQGLLYVKYRGVEQCWSYDQYDAYKEQWEQPLENGGLNGLQFNFSG